MQKNCQPITLLTKKPVVFASRVWHDNRNRMERRKKCPSDKDKFGRLYFKWKLFAIKSPGKWDVSTGEKTLDSAVGSEKNPTKIQETVVDSPGNENGDRCKLAKSMAPKVKIQQIIQCVGGGAGEGFRAVPWKSWKTPRSSKKKRGRFCWKWWKAKRVKPYGCTRRRSRPWDENDRWTDGTPGEIFPAVLGCPLGRWPENGVVFRRKTGGNRTEQRGIPQGIPKGGAAAAWENLQVEL